MSGKKVYEAAIDTRDLNNGQRNPFEILLYRKAPVIEYDPELKCYKIKRNYKLTEVRTETSGIYIYHTYRFEEA